MAKQESGLPQISGYNKRNWGWLFGLGLLFILIGFVSLGMVVTVTLASMFVIGALIVFAGVSQIVDVFRSKDWKAVLWHFLIGLLYIFLGCLIVYDPFLASTIITALLAWTLIFIGVVRSIMAFALRESQGWVWLLLAGLAALVLGIMILMQWPASGLWVIGLLISIELIVNGWAYIFLAFALRRPDPR